jgi:hypothetical protein
MAMIKNRRVAMGTVMLKDVNKINNDCKDILIGTLGISTHTWTMDQHNLSVLLMTNNINTEREGAKKMQIQQHIQLKSITCFLCGYKRQTELQCQRRDNKKCKGISLSNFHKIYLIHSMPLC